MSSITLSRCRLGDGTLADVTFDATSGSVTALAVLDDDGPADRLLLRSAVEPHAHLDKAFLADRVVNETGDLAGAIAAMRAARPLLGVAETAERAARALRTMAANGYRAVRTHVDVTSDNALTSVEAIGIARRRVGALIDVEVVALAGFPVLGPAGSRQRALLVEALDAGADLVGGCPHLERFAGHRDTADDGGPDDAPVIRRATETYLQIAADAGVGVDLHTDETLDPVADGLSALAELVTATGFAGRVTASHCVSLAMRPEGEQSAIAERVAAAGIGVVALPATNLFLQGRDHRQAMPRGVTAVAALRRAGVTVAAGADNVQDPFNPLGRFSPFETAGLMVLTSHLSPVAAWDSVSAIAARVLGLDHPAIAVGTPADLIAVPATDIRQAIAAGGFAPQVWRHGTELSRAER